MNRPKISPKTEVDRQYDKALEVIDKQRQELEQTRAALEAANRACASLSFERLREVNVKRCEDVFHPLADWSPTDWATAMAGECGEACNEVKKLRRLDGADSVKDNHIHRMELRQKIGKELADLVIYADLLAARLDISLGDSVVSKFNEVSDRCGSQTKLASACGLGYKSPAEWSALQAELKQAQGALAMNDVKLLSPELDALRIKVAALEQANAALRDAANALLAFCVEHSGCLPIHDRMRKAIDGTPNPSAWVRKEKHEELREEFEAVRAAMHDYKRQRIAAETEREEIKKALEKVEAELETVRGELRRRVLGQ